MVTTLRELSSALTAALKNGDLTVTAGAVGVPVIDNFLATRPAQSITLRQAKIQLSDQQPPATLTVSGGLQDTWPLPGPAAQSLRTQSATITYRQASATGPVTAELTVAADPAATWELVPGKLRLSRIGASILASYETSGPNDRFGGSIHATLGLGRDVDVVIGLAPGQFWEVDVAAAGGLPTLGTVAALVGAEEQVRTGLAAVGLGDISPQAVRIGVDRAGGTISFISVRGSISLAGTTVEVDLQLPHFTFGGTLPEATTVSLTPLLTRLLGEAASLPDATVSELDLSAIPEAGYYCLTLAVPDHKITAGQYGLVGVTMDIDKRANGLAASISGTIAVAGTPLMLLGSYGPDWVITGQLTQLPLSALIGEVLPGSALPSALANLNVTNLSASLNLRAGSFAFSGEVNVDPGQGKPATKLTLSISSTVDRQSAKRVTTGKLTGASLPGALDLTLPYDFKPGP